VKFQWISVNIAPQNYYSGALLTEIPRVFTESQRLSLIQIKSLEETHQQLNRRVLEQIDKLKAAGIYEWVESSSVDRAHHRIAKWFVIRSLFTDRARLGFSKRPSSAAPRNLAIIGPRSELGSQKKRKRKMTSFPLPRQAYYQCHHVNEITATTYPFLCRSMMSS